MGSPASYFEGLNYVKQEIALLEYEDILEVLEGKKIRNKTRKHLWA